MVNAQAVEGEMFGLQIGDRLEAYDASNLVLEWFSFPYVEIESEQMADEFSRLQVLVTPVSGTILGFRAVANFDTEEPARAFAERLQKALTARFGASIFCFVREGPGFAEHPCWEADGAEPRLAPFGKFDLYMASPGEYELSLHLYGSKMTGSGAYEVQLAFGIDVDAPVHRTLMETSSREANEFDAANEAAFLQRERSGVLRGIE